jgi:hypothetical protein
MAKVAVSAELRSVAAVQARLMDRYIDLVQAELARTEAQFTREALRDMLASLREERDSYRGLVGLQLVENAA